MTANNPNPWVPISDALTLKHIGKLGEECCELGAAIFRCIIQGIDEAEPVTGKVNRVWLQEEIADVIANSNLVRNFLQLDATDIALRVGRKTRQLKLWHEMLPDERKRS